MNTPSHLITTAALRKVLRGRLPTPRNAVLLGAVAPDLPLYLMSLGGLFYYRCVLGWESRPTFEHMFDRLYFQDPFWLAAHNTLHSPTLLLLLLAGMWVATHLQRTLPSWIFWFLMACLFHSIGISERGHTTLLTSSSFLRSPPAKGYVSQHDGSPMTQRVLLAESSTMDGSALLGKILQPIGGWLGKFREGAD
ncbi:MAG: hypothetical protein HYV60_14335 [Planctomycetia bacterium]|nr:hypothetical protein [Planctomycetia bacterium]